jgi:uncharacterized protein YqgV (UPF0045/DUF77 family)
MSKVNTIREKYSSLREPTFKTFNDGDKTPTKKYLDRMCYYWVNKNLNKMSTKKIIDVVLKFDELLPFIENKDIYNQYYNSFATLINVVEKAEEKKFEKDFKREDHVIVIEENDDFLMIQPTTITGSLKYGAGTKWCTSSKSTPSHFDRYSKHNTLIYVINKKISDRSNCKMAIIKRNGDHLDTLNGEAAFYNPNDIVVGLSWFVKNGWDENIIVKIMMLYNVQCFKNNKYRKIKHQVDDTITIIKNINLTELISSVNFLNEIGIHDSEETQKNKKIVDDFVSKISTLKIK